SSRRHTSSTRDCSSDVCSSDLKRPPPARLRASILSNRKLNNSSRPALLWHSWNTNPMKVLPRPPASRFLLSSKGRLNIPGMWTRSEERRVGKECSEGDGGGDEN